MKKTILAISTVTLLLLGGCENKKDLLLGEWKEKGIEDSYLTIEKDKIISQYDYDIQETGYKFKNKKSNEFELYLKLTDKTVKGEFLRNNKEFVIYQEGAEDEKEIYERLE